MSRRAVWIACVAGLAGCAAPSVEPAAPAVIGDHWPEQTAVVSVEPWSFRGSRGMLVRTPSHRLFLTERDPAIVTGLPEFMERALDHYTSALAPLPRPTLRLDTFLLENRDQWAELTRQLMGPSAPLYLRIQRGGYSAGGRAVLYALGPIDTFTIAAHEGWHQYTQRTFSEALPVWLEEGIAAYMEGRVSAPPAAWGAGPPPGGLAAFEFAGWANAERLDTLTRADAGGLMALDELLNTGPHELLSDSRDATLAYYAQVWALVHFLHEGDSGRHADALRRLLRDAAEGRLRETVRGRVSDREARSAFLTGRGSAVFRAYFGEPGALDGAYRAFVAQLREPGAREAALAGRSPFTP